MRYLRVWLCASALLALIVCVESRPSAQATKDVERDVKVAFDAKPDDVRGQPFEYILAKAQNDSANNYPCVVVTFNVGTIKNEYLGTASGEIRDVGPRSERTSRVNITIPNAGSVWFRSVSECSGPPPGTCTIKVSIANDKEEYRTSVQLKYEDGTMTNKAPRRLSLGEYEFGSVPEGKYIVKPQGQYPRGDGRGGGLAPFPTTQSVDCERNRTHPLSFKIDSIEG